MPPAVAEPELAEVPTIAGAGEVATWPADCIRSRRRCSAPSIALRRPVLAPFVDVGARVEPDTVVCLIEVMKMMNAVPAGVAGTIVEVCAENAQLVEDGAPLFQVRSDR